MKFYKASADAAEDNFHMTYWVEADSLLSKSEISEYLAHIATTDFLDAASSEGERFEIDIQDVDMDGYLVSVMDYQHVRPVLTITALNNICNTILTVSKVYHHNISEEPEFFIFSGAAGQEQDITSIGDTLECSREDAVQAGYDEVLYQLKKYFQIPSVVMASGLFTVQSISYPEYQLELEERELVLD